ncbi:hypothetical protein ONZ51_g5830 [Trametes cubensis]|uniref:Ribonuclease H1 N-terminal domain-containing protein n=1 Tax=Trametes cubensis TaxID=1111947 RepID=A0AAD7TT70_9APHY|nr:hypothetical protein ONZ51_g5830 [Trametes cubensis]
MGKIDSAVIEEFDGLASMLGLTPKFNSQNEIIPIGAKDPRGKVYVVWIGRGIGLFYNWGLTGAMVKGFPGAIYKSFPTLEEAHQAWYGGPSVVPGWTPPAPRPAISTPHSQSRPSKPSNAKQPKAQPADPIPTVHPPPLVHVRLPAEAAFDSDGSDSEIQDERSPRTRRGLPACSDNLPPTPATDSCGDDLNVYYARLRLTTYVNAHETTPCQTRPAASKRTTESPSSPAISTDTSGRESPELPYERVHVRKGEYVFVVIRGDRPGIYFDRTTALVAAGYRPGMKVVPFKSLRRAAWYFTQQYMKYRVGVPIVDVSDEE